MCPKKECCGTGKKKPGAGTGRGGRVLTDVFIFNSADIDDIVVFHSVLKDSIAPLPG